jgi:hypothetical protein
LSVWTRISPDIIQHVEENRDRRLERERANRRRLLKADVEAYWVKTKAAIKAEIADIDLPPFPEVANLALVKRFWDAGDDDEDLVLLNDASWAAVSAEVVSTALELAYRFKLNLAAVIVTALDGTPHAVEASLASKILAAVESVEMGSEAVSEDDLVELLAQYKHHFRCSKCETQYYLRGGLYSATELLKHFESAWQHQSDDSTLSHPFYSPEWAELATTALGIVGADKAGNDNSTLKAVGERWLCEACPLFKDDLERRNAIRVILNKPQMVGLEWSDIVRPGSHSLLFLPPPTIFLRRFPTSSRTTSKRASTPLHPFSSSLPHPSWPKRRRKWRSRLSFQSSRLSLHRPLLVADQLHHSRPAPQ